MTRRIGNVLVIEPEEPQRCDLCDKVDELRPYGPNGENVCFECGMKDEKAALRAYSKRMGLSAEETEQLVASVRPVDLDRPTSGSGAR